MSAEDKANAHWMQDHTDPYGSPAPRFLGLSKRAIGVGVVAAVALGGGYAAFDTWSDTKAAQVAVEMRKLELAEMRETAKLNQVNRPSIDADRSAQMSCIKDLSKSGEPQAAEACAAIFGPATGTALNTATVAGEDDGWSFGEVGAAALAVLGLAGWLARKNSAPTA